LYAALLEVIRKGAVSVPAASPAARSTTPPLTNSFVPAAVKPIAVRPSCDVAIDALK